MFPRGPASGNQGGTLVTGPLGPRILLPMPEVESGQVEPDTMSRVELEIQAGEPIRGQLSASGIGALRFHGWLELVAAIQSARNPRPMP
jgi:hypothetical protein